MVSVHLRLKDDIRALSCALGKDMVELVRYVAVKEIKRWRLDWAGCDFERVDTRVAEEDIVEDGVLQILHPDDDGTHLQDAGVVDQIRCELRLS